MADNYEKLWLQRNLHKNAHLRAVEAIKSTGRALPCSVVAVNGSIVTVQFEADTAPWVLPRITIPKAESQWMRSPTQIGDSGMTVPADTYLGGISGLGGGTAKLTKQYGNLTTLVFVPVASTGFSSVNTNATYISGPDGAVIETPDSYASLSVSTSGITLSYGSKTVTLNSAGLTIDGVLFDTHQHLYTPGTGTPTNTGGPVA